MYLKVNFKYTQSRHNNVSATRIHPRGDPDLEWSLLPHEHLWIKPGRVSLSKTLNPKQLLKLFENVCVTGVCRRWSLGRACVIEWTNAGGSGMESIVRDER